MMTHNVIQMVKRTTIACVALLLVSANAAGDGNEKSDDKALEQAPLSALDFFVGSCWRGVFDDGKSIDTHCFKPVYGGKFVRDNHDVVGPRGPLSGETLFHWNAESNRIEYTYWDSKGGVSTGAMLPTADGLRSPEEVYVLPDGKEMRMVTSWLITGEHTWEQRSVSLDAGEEMLLFSIQYEREGGK